MLWCLQYSRLQRLRVLAQACVLKVQFPLSTSLESEKDANAHLRYLSSRSTVALSFLSSSTLAQPRLRKAISSSHQGESNGSSWIIHKFHSKQADRAARGGQPESKRVWAPDMSQHFDYKDSMSSVALSGILRHWTPSETRHCSSWSEGWSMTEGKGCDGKGELGLTLSNERVCTCKLEWSQSSDDQVWHGSH